MREITRKKLTELAQELGIVVDDDQQGINYLWPFVEAVRRDRSVFIVKVDGGRTRPEDGGAYTVFATGKRLEGQPCRADGCDVEEVMAEVVLGYANIVWKGALPE